MGKWGSSQLCLSSPFPRFLNVPEQDSPLLTRWQFPGYPGQPSVIPNFTRFFFVSSAPKQPVPQLLSLGHHSEVWLFQLGLPNDSRISVVSGVGIKYKGVPGSAGPSLQGGSVCLSVCLASPFAPFIPAITLNTPFFTREELAVLIPPLDGKSASTLA